MKSVQLVFLAGTVSLAMVAAAASAVAYTTTIYSGPINLFVPDNDPNGASTTLTVPDLAFVSDVNLAVLYTHGNGNQTSFQLTAPDGTVILVQGNGIGSSAVNGGVVFDDEATLSWSDAFSGLIPSPISGSFNTSVGGNPLSGFDGKLAQGDWTLVLQDHVAPGSGVLSAWSLIFDLLPIDGSTLGTTIPAIISGDANALVGSFADRASARYSGGVGPVADVVNPYLPGGTGGMWMRMGGASTDGEGGISNLFTANTATYDKTQWFAQSGFSHVLYETSNKKWVGSVFGHYSESDAEVADSFGAAGSVDTKSYGAGYSSTWLFTNGFYLDSVGLLNWQDIAVATTGGDTGTTDAFTMASSTELGMNLPLTDTLSLVPQLQGIYQRIDIDSFTDSGGNTYAFKDNDSFMGRAGLGLSYSSAAPDSGHRLHADITASVLNQFLNGGTTVINGTTLGFEGVDAASWQVAAGVDMTPITTGFGLGVRANYRDSFKSDGESAYGGDLTLFWRW